MGRDVEIADAGVIGQRDRHRRLQPALSPARFQDVGDGAGAEGVALERAVDGGGEFLRAVVVEQREQPRGVGAERFAARRQALEQRGDRRDREPQTVARTRRIVPGASPRRARRRAPPARSLRRCRSCGRGARSPRCRRPRARWSDSRAASAGGARACAESSSCCGRSARTGSCRTRRCASRRSRRDARAAARGAAAPRRGPRRRSDRAARDAGADARSRRASAETARSGRRRPRRCAPQRRHGEGIEFGARSSPSHWRGPGVQGRGAK